jgi:hypothetical protein
MIGLIKYIKKTCFVSLQRSSRGVRYLLYFHIRVLVILNHFTVPLTVKWYTVNGIVKLYTIKKGELIYD